jgi:hypothetical protein
MDFRTGYRPRLRTVSLLRKNRLRMRICVGAAIAVAATASAVTWNGAPSATHAVAAAAAAPAARLALADTHPAAAKNVRPVYPYSIVPGGVATRADVQQRVDTDQVVAKHYASFDIARTHAMVVPPIDLITDEQRARYAKAEERKRSRQALHGRNR